MDIDQGGPKNQQCSDGPLRWRSVCSNGHGTQWLTEFTARHRRAPVDSCLPWKTCAEERHVADQRVTLVTAIGDGGSSWPVRVKDTVTGLCLDAVSDVYSLRAGCGCKQRQRRSVLEEEKQRLFLSTFRLCSVYVAKSSQPPPFHNAMPHHIFNTKQIPAVYMEVNVQYDWELWAVCIPCYLPLDVCWLQAGPSWTSCFFFFCQTACLRTDLT